MKKQSPSPFRYVVVVIVVALSVASVTAIVMIMNSSAHRTARRSFEDSATDRDPHQIRIESPHEDDVVDGQISVQGTVTRPGDYRIEVRDHVAVLGEKTISVTENDGGMFSTLIPITQSPHRETGTIRVIYKEDSAIHSEVDVAFKIQEVAGRVRLLGPLPNQIMKGSSVAFRGGMKGFFEGVMHIRLKDDQGAVLFSDTIRASTDNYEEFAQFDTTLKYGTIVAANLGNGSWEVYDVSPKDGTASALISFPVKFKE